MKNMNKKNVNINRKLLLSITVLLIWFVFVGPMEKTVAWMYVQGQLINNFFSPVVDITIVETESDSKKNFSVRNDSNTSVYIRVEAIASFVNSKGAIVASAKVGSGHAMDGCAVSVNVGTEWSRGSDGYYYYIKPVKPDELTKEVFQAYSVSDTTNEFHLNVYAQAIQAEDLASAWSGVTINADGTLSTS